MRVFMQFSTHLINPFFRKTFFFYYIKFKLFSIENNSSLIFLLLEYLKRRLLMFILLLRLSNKSSILKSWCFSAKLSMGDFVSLLISYLYVVNTTNYRHYFELVPIICEWFITIIWLKNSKYLSINVTLSARSFY